MGDAAEVGAIGIDAWLRSDGQVVAASERAARAVAAAYHRGRRAEGLTAWLAPRVQNWEEFAQRAWRERVPNERVLLNPAQEQALWARLIASDRGRATLLEGPLYRVAKLAMEAHRLLCFYAPQFLRPAARAAWQQDAGAFSAWLAAFDEACRTGGLISAARVPLELIDLIKDEGANRPPLMLAGFDRMLPVQRTLLETWGAWREAPRGATAARIHFYEAADENAELTACALWCKSYLAASPKARLLIVTQDAAKRRGAIERAFLRFGGSGRAAAETAPLFEFSLGVPLKNVTLPRGATLVLRWLSGAIEEHALDWLFSTGQLALDEQESRTLTAFMRALRRRGWQQTRWHLEDFLRQRPGEALPSAWSERMQQAARRLREFSHASSSATPISWSELAPQLLEMTGWPGGRALASAEFQAMRRWQEVLDECASLGFDARRISWNDFLHAIDRALGETLFTPESQDAPILIAGPAESAGLVADAVWFLGASEDAWPAPGAAHPLLPLEVQRATGMPHASAQLDWSLAEAVTNGLLASTAEIHFSYARQSEGIEARASRLVARIAGRPAALPPELSAPPAPDTQTIFFEDRSWIPFPGGEVRGGANVLTAQSQCAFKAFATARLGAEAWQPAEPSLTPAQRGQLLHAVLHAVWSGPPAGIRSHADLLQLADLGAFVAPHVRAALQEGIRPSARETMPRRYLQLEEQRLIRLVTEWLAYERTRAPFIVEETEAERDKSIAGLELHLRLDRVDRLGDATFLVIDYKTGDVSPKAWELPRPDDVQLPLYAGFALDPESEPLAGLVFAKIRAGDLEFSGRVADAKTTLMADLHPSSALVRSPLKREDLQAWRTMIEDLVCDFLAGRAEVNPREYPETCERCSLQTLCRVEESRPHVTRDSNGVEEEADA